jgi:hypothetical protein
VKRFTLPVGVLLLFGLIAFEAFNFATTRGALEYFIPGKFMNAGMATILAIAACCSDFGGLARMFTPEKGKDEPLVIYFLIVGWLLTSAINAFMTWFYVLMGVRGIQGVPLFSRDQIIQVIPVIIAVFVWLVRILIVGAVAMAGEQVLWGKRGAPRISIPRPVTGRQSKPALQGQLFGTNGGHSWKTSLQKSSAPSSDSFSSL